MTTEIIRVGDAHAAAALIALGLRPRHLPARDVVYADLVRRHAQDPVFADLTEAVAAGLGLAVLDVNPQIGIVLAPMSDSAFELKMDDYVRRAKLGERRNLEKVLHGLAHLAIAALAFPRPEDLADDSYVNRVSVDQVDGVVRDACEALARRIDGNDDPLADTMQLETVWRAYARRPEAGATKDGRAREAATRGIIAKALRFLTEQGLLSQVNGDGGGTYRTTTRYQIQVRELAAEEAFRELLALQVLPIGVQTAYEAKR